MIFYFNKQSPIKILMALFFLCLAFPQKAFAIEDDTLKFSYPKETIQIDSIEDGKVLEFKFTITNNYNEEVEFMQIHPSCGCTVIDIGAFTLKPGESKEITITFNSAGRLGANYKELHVINNKGMFTVSFNVFVKEKG